MVRPKELVDVVGTALKNSGNLPDEVTYIGYEPDFDTQAIKLPIVEVSPVSIEMIDEENTDFVGYKTDGLGNQTGKVYQSLYMLTLDVRVLTAQGSKWNPHTLGDEVRSVLYEYDTSAIATPLHDEVWRVRLGDGDVDNNFTYTAPLRAWSQELEIYAIEEFETEAEYIAGFTIEVTNQ